jgi:tetratricopeptide (TPR) repeat protein
MNNDFVLPKIFSVALVAFALGAGAPALLADEAATNTALVPAVFKSDTVVTQQDALRAYLQIQEQLHATQLAIERSRQDAEEVAASNALGVGERLNVIEKAVREQQASNRLVLLVTVALAVTGLGFLGVLSASFFQSRAMQRFTETALGLQQQRSLGAGADPRLLGGGSAEVSSAQLIATLERLEKHIRELEAAKALPALVETNGHGGEVSPRGEPVALSESARQIEMLLGKGQSLLSLGQNEAALASFDEALAIDPKHTEALIKKGAAFEKMQRLDDAVACYDRAIAADSTVTIAYLYKGGVFNRMERYNEALACYEQALKTQEKTHAHAA